MRHAVVDKRVAGIVRWLERLKSSYSQGAMEIALMDAECARADLEVLRQDVFTKCSGVKINPFTKFFELFSRVLFLSLLIVLFSVAPISRELTPVLPEINQDSNKIVLAEPVIIIREDSPAEIEKKPAPVQTINNKKAKRLANKPVKEEAAIKPAPVNQVQAVNKKVPYDQVFTLMQTGERALKGNKTVIINNK